MKYISFKNKLKQMFDKTSNIEIDVSQKTKSYNDLSSPSEGIKVPKTLYDSGWIVATLSGMGG